MKPLKTSLIVALIVPAFSIGAMAFDHHGGDDEKERAEAKAAKMAMMKKKCAEAEDMEKCMADMKAAMMKKKAEKKEDKQ